MDQTIFPLSLCLVDIDLIERKIEDGCSMTKIYTPFTWFRGYVLIRRLGKDERRPVSLWRLKDNLLLLALCCDVGLGRLEDVTAGTRIKVYSLEWQSNI